MELRYKYFANMVQYGQQIIQAAISKHMQNMNFKTWNTLKYNNATTQYEDEHNSWELSVFSAILTVLWSSSFCFVSPYYWCTMYSSMDETGKHTIAGLYTHNTQLWSSMSVLRKRWRLVCMRSTRCPSGLWAQNTQLLEIQAWKWKRTALCLAISTCHVTGSSRHANPDKQEHNLSKVVANNSYRQMKLDPALFSTVLPVRILNRPEPPHSGGTTCCTLDLVTSGGGQLGHSISILGIVWVWVHKLKTAWFEDQYLFDPFFTSSP